MDRLDAVVVGAGQAGLAASRQLASAGVRHVVLERGRIGETWRSQRWGSFRLNTPNWMNRLPGDEEQAPEPPDAFQSAPEFADRLAAYAARERLPVREGAAVVRVGQGDAADLVVEVAGGPGGDVDCIRARSVVVASGAQNVGRTPAVAADLPAHVTQLHSVDYRGPADLPAGAVLVVGSGQTGGQLAEDLLDAGRRVYLSPSRVARCPRRYRGQDILVWLVASGFYDVPLDALPDPALQFARQPLISGTGPGGHTLSLQSLAARGVTLVGRIRAVDGETLLLDDMVADCVRFGDTGAATIRGIAEAACRDAVPPPPPPDEDPVDAAHPDPDGLRSPARLDVAEAGIGTVIWATGVRGEFGWLPGPAVGPDGAPIHAGGVTPVPGLFVLGLPWLSNRGSGIIYGIGGDASRIAGLVAARAGRALSPPSPGLTC